MPRRKSKNKISDILEERSSSRSQRSKASLQKMIGIMIGIAVTLSAIGIISAMSVSFGHMNPHDLNTDYMASGDMMSGDMPMMHSMVMGGNGGMMKHHDEMTQDEIEEMLKEMDKDGDGSCDYCDMSLEMCREMMDI